MQHNYLIDQSAHKMNLGNQIDSKFASFGALGLEICVTAIFFEYRPLSNSGRIYWAIKYFLIINGMVTVFQIYVINPTMIFSFFAVSNSQNCHLSVPQPFSLYWTASFCPINHVYEQCCNFLYQYHDQNLDKQLLSAAQICKSNLHTVGNCGNSEHV